MKGVGPGTCGPRPSGEIDEARFPALGMMQIYSNAAQSSASIAALFKLKGKTAWKLREITVGEEALNSQNDVLADGGAQTSPTKVKAELEQMRSHTAKARTSMVFRNLDLGGKSIDQAAAED